VATNDASVGVRDGLRLHPTSRRFGVGAAMTLYCSWQRWPHLRYEVVEEGQVRPAAVRQASKD
jgi:hypothetical protein